jgi:hypothetical protein
MSIRVPVKYVGSPSLRRGASIENPSGVWVVFVKGRQGEMLREEPGKGILGFNIKLTPDLNTAIAVAVLKGSLSLQYIGMDAGSAGSVATGELGSMCFI